MAIHVLSNGYRKPVRCLVRLSDAPYESNGISLRLKEVTVEARRGEPTYALLQFELQKDPNATSREQPIGLRPGAPITIEADFGGRCEEVMRGFVRRVRTKSVAKAKPKRVIVAVECQDESLLLEAKTVRRRWGEGSSIDARSMIDPILTQPGLKLDPSSSPGLDGIKRPQETIKLRCSRSHCRRLAIRSEQHLPSEPVLQKAEGELDSAYYGHVLRVGEPVRVDGVSERYDGVYVVENVAHRFAANDYQQFFALARSIRDSVMDSIEIGALRETPGILYDAL